MIVTKIGDRLAVALPADDVARLGLKEGDEVEVEVKRTKNTLSSEDVRKLTPDAWLKRMERFSGMLPDDFKFDRDEANER